MTKLELIDARIKEVESTLVYLLHERLALVKCETVAPKCDHDIRVNSVSKLFCTKCGEVQK